MTEKRKGVWTNHWKGWRAVLSLFGILFAAVLLALLAVEWLSEHPRMMKGDVAAQALILAAASTILVTTAVVFIGWVRSWRNFRRFLFGLVCFVTLVALFYAEENIRGRLAWSRYVKEQAADGEVLDLLQLAPAPVPDGQNFFATPLYEPMRFEMVDGHPVWAGTNWHSSAQFDVYGGRPYPSDLPRLVNNKAIGRLDLAEWQSYYRRTKAEDLENSGLATNWFPIVPEPQSPAEDVLLALSRFDDKRRLLIEACSRPRSRFWVNYEEGFAALLPHLAPLKSATMYLSLHAVAALQAGKPDTAFEDVAVSLRLIESVRDEPILISHLVRIAMLEITMQAVLEGVADNRWSEEQLAAIELQLEQLDFLTDYRLVMRGERAFGIWNVDYVEKHRRSGAREVLSMGGTASEGDTLKEVLVVSLYRLAPEGWFDLSKRVLCETISDALLPVADTKARTIKPAFVRNAQVALSPRPTLYNAPVRLFLPGLGKAATKFAAAQTSTDLARVAIALERYRLDSGKFPESLDSLVPDFIEDLPHDVINGEPLHYRRTADGQFVLYSVGWNETNDGGQIAFHKGGDAIDRNEGDWVWRYPEE